VDLTVEIVIYGVALIGVLLAAEKYIRRIG
jgi:hypothetical protein